MTEPTLDIVAIGNAIVDVIAQAEEAFVLSEGVAKGSMRLMDEATSDSLYSRMASGREISGGSAANTVAGMAMLGCKCGFIGQVADDQLGEVFKHDIRANGVVFDTPVRSGQPSTARCLILVTPDAQRTMNTFLGASQFLPESALDRDQIASAKILYLEGYLWDPASAKQAFLKASEIAHGAGRKVALTLSDSFCVDRYRDEFLDLMRKGTVDIVFANESELHSLYQTADFDTALGALRKDIGFGVVTRSERGCIVATKDGVTPVPASPIKELVDTTGAGDLFAAGFLFGLVRGASHTDAGRLGALAAAEVIQHVGARPQVSLKDLAQQSGLPV